MTIRRAYHKADDKIFEKSVYLGKGGSTVVTPIFINSQKFTVANVGDAHAVICRNGIAKGL